MTPDAARDYLMLMIGFGLGLGAFNIILFVWAHIEIRRSKKLLTQMKKELR